MTAPRVLIASPSRAELDVEDVIAPSHVRVHVTSMARDERTENRSFAEWG